MPSYSFGLIVAGVDFSDDDVVNAAFKAGIEDASFAVRDGSSVVYVDREATSYIEALIGTIIELEAALPGSKVAGIQENDLVGTSGAALITDRSRQNLHQHIQGRRGSRDFPAPLTWLDQGRPVWLRGDVLRWGKRELILQDPRSSAAEVDLAWPSLVSGVFHMVRASLHDPQDFRPALDLLCERYLALTGDDPETRRELSEHLQALADRVATGALSKPLL